MCDRIYHKNPTRAVVILISILQMGKLKLTEVKEVAQERMGEVLGFLKPRADSISQHVLLSSCREMAIWGCVHLKGVCHQLVYKISQAFSTNAHECTHPLHTCSIHGICCGDSFSQ